MSRNIDPEFSDLFAPRDAEFASEVRNALSDAFFAADVEAGAGDFDFAELQESLKGVHEKFDKRFTREVPPATPKAKPAADVTLSKAAANERAKLAIRNFVKSSLALGETAENLAAHARKTDPATADLILEIAAELEA